MGNLVIDLLSRKVFLFNTDFASKTATVDTVTGDTGATTYALTDVNNGAVLELHQQVQLHLYVQQA